MRTGPFSLNCRKAMEPLMFLSPPWMWAIALRGNSWKDKWGADEKEALNLGEFMEEDS